jgi:hypothetical protein
LQRNYGSGFSFNACLCGRGEFSEEGSENV